MSKSSTFRFIRIATTTILLIYVLHQAGLFRVQGWLDLVNTVANTNLYWIAASLLVAFLLNLSSSLKWFMLAQSKGLDVSLWRLHAYYMVGKFFNLVLPSSIGGDFVRMHELGRYTGRHADATAVVFVERFTGLVTLVLLAFAAVVVNLKTYNMPWLTTTLAITALAMGFICWLIVDERPFNLVQRICGDRIPLLQAIFTKIKKFRKAVVAYREDPVALWWALINSLIFYLLAVINVWFCLLAFGATVSFATALMAVPVIMFIMNLPFSIGGIGLMEFAFSFTLGLFGVQPAIAISVALFIRARSLLDAGVGSVLYPVVTGKKMNRAEFSKEMMDSKKQSRE